MHAGILFVHFYQYLQVKCLHILSILELLRVTTGAPTVAAAVVRLPDTKENGFQFTTAQGKDLIEQVDCVLTPAAGSKSNLLKTEAVATIALYYVNHSNFIFIAIDPYDAKHFGSLISYTSKEFNLTKLHELYQIDEDHAGLVEAVKVNDNITLNLEGQSPSSKECK